MDETGGCAAGCFFVKLLTYADNQVIMIMGICQQRYRAEIV